MASLDASLADPNDTTRMAFRRDAYLLALKLVKEAGMFEGVDSATDVLYVAQFLAGIPGD